MRYKRLLAFLVPILIVCAPLGINAQESGLLPGENLSTNPKERIQLVTATVPDIVPPSTPILISPADESVLTTSTPTFEWQASTDNVGVSHYQFWRDGVLLFDTLPTVATETAEYALLYDSGLLHFFLTPKTGFSDGHHTWQVHAYDTAGNFSQSVIWDFTIDTTAPYFEITDIGPNAVDINTGDANSVPTEPIHLSTNEPLLLGIGESNADVQLTITIPDDPTQTHTFTTNGDGNWDFQIGILPRGVAITLDFVISDASGNISIISDLQIIIDPIVIIIPPPSPTPTPPPTPTPTPGVSPEPSPIPTPSPSPSPEPSPLLVITITPPREIIHEIIQETLEATPEEITNLIPPQIIEALRQSMRVLSPAGALLVTVLLPLLSLLALFLNGGQLSLEFFLRFLQAIGLIPAQEPQGIVFNSQTNEPVPFALLTIESIESSETIFETVVTDENGIYQGIQLPHGVYKITVAHQDYTFPTIKEKPNYLSINDFYKGETFRVSTDKTHQLFLIPIDPKDEKKREINVKNWLRLTLARIRMKNLLIPMFILSLIFTLISPTRLNYIVIFLYLLVFIKKYVISNRRATIKGTITTRDGTPIENAVIRISDPKTTELMALVTTNKNGMYGAYCKPGLYYISITKSEYVWYRDSGNMGFQEVTISEKPLLFETSLTSFAELSGTAF